MKFKKIFLLTIFSATLGQSTFSAATEPSQKAEAKTKVVAKKEKTKVRRALEIFGAVAGLAAGIAAFVYREQIQSFFTNSNDKPVGDDNLNDEPVFDFITGHGIFYEGGIFYIPDPLNDNKPAPLDGTSGSLAGFTDINGYLYSRTRRSRNGYCIKELHQPKGYVFFIDRHNQALYLSKHKRFCSTCSYYNSLTWDELLAAHKKLIT